MKYIGKPDTPIAGAEIRETEKEATVGFYKKVNYSEFEVWINGQYKARFKELQHAVNSVCRSFEVEEIPLNEWDLWWDFEV